MQNASTNRDQRSFNTPLVTCVVLALSTALLDLLLGILDSPQHFAVYRTAAASVSITIIAFILLYSVLWIVLGQLSVRIFKLSYQPFAISLAVALGMIFVCASFSDFQFLVTLKYLLKAILALAFSIAVAVLAYVSSDAAIKFGWFRRVATNVLVAFPILLAETIAIWRLRMSVTGELSYLLKAAIVIGGVSLIAFTLWFFDRHIKQERVTKLLLTVTFLLLLAPLASFFSTDPSVEARAKYKPASRPVKRVILVTIDTLRQDALSVYGNGEISTPNIDQFSKDGVLYTKAISEAPWTLPSIASIFTGVSSFVHLVQQVENRIPLSIPTLAEYMSGAGYYTTAIGSNVLLDNASFSRGFLEYHFFPSDHEKHPEEPTFGLTLLKRIQGKNNPAPSTQKITAFSKMWLEKNKDKNFFLWIHYYDPHLPYVPPQPLIPEEKPPVTVGSAVSLQLASAIKMGFFVPTLREREWIKKLYLAEAKSVDQGFGSILAALKENALYEDSLMIVTSDHGEEFWEHGKQGHSHSVYNELLRVPLVIKFPAGEAGLYESNVSITQILPTILDVCEIRSNPQFSLWSLVPYKDNPPPDEPVISANLAQFHHSIAVSFGTMKYIQDLITNREELYDLTADSQEQTSIASLYPEQLQKARDILKEFKNESTRLRQHYKVIQKQKSNLDEETEEKLRALGYIQ